MDAAVHVLTELSHQVSVALTPAMSDTILKAVEFVPVDTHRVLCVVVSADGFVDNRLVETESPVSREDLIRCGNFLTDNFAGKTLREICDRLLTEMAEDRAVLDRWMTVTIELARQGLVADGDRRDVLVEGTAGLLSYPELADVDRVRRMFEAFEERVRLVTILNRCLLAEGVRVLIGEDSELTSELGFSLVTRGYGVGDRTLGTVGILGPARMDYDRLIPLVNYLGESLSRVLATNSSEREGE